jgi:hypothetical protein
MTEQEWLTSGSPDTLLDYCWRTASARKKRLFGCACCYRAWHLLPDPRCKTAVRVAERFADGTSPSEALDTAHRSARTMIDKHRRIIRRKRYMEDAQELFSGTAACSSVAFTDPDSSRWTWTDIANTLLASGSKWHAELVAICDIIRDIFGNPYRSVAFTSAWRSSDVRSVAPAVVQHILAVAARVLKGVGQNGYLVECAFMVNAAGEGDHVGSEPRGVE